MEQRIISFLLNHYIIDYNEKEIYEYGLKKLKGILLNVVLTVVAGIVLGLGIESIIFLISYASLRRYAGGYHAPSERSCMLLSMLLVITVLLSVKYISVNYKSLICIAVISSIAIYIKAPVESRNKPLNEKERRIYRIKTRVILCIELIIAGIIGVCSYMDTTKCMVFSLASVALLTLFSDKPDNSSA